MEADGAKKNNLGHLGIWISFVIGALSFEP
jgi:hypothetical protein